MAPRTTMDVKAAWEQGVRSAGMRYYDVVPESREERQEREIEDAKRLYVRDVIDLPALERIIGRVLAGR